MITLYDFCRRTDDIIDGDGPREKKWAQLKDWRARLLFALRHESDSSDLAAIASIVRQYGISSDLLLELIDGVTMDLTTNRYETFEELYPYCYRVGSTVGLISIEILGYRNPSAKQYAEQLGIALQLTNILRDLKTDARRGRIYLPLEDLRSHGYCESDLLGLRANSQFETLIRFESQRARSHFQAARDNLDRDDLVTLYPAEIMATVYERILGRIEANPAKVFDRKVSVSAPWRMWAAARLALKHRRRELHEP